MTSPSVRQENERILALIALGYLRDEIAVELDLSPNTVRRIIRAECRKRGLTFAGLRAVLATEAEGA